MTDSTDSLPHPAQHRAAEWTFAFQASIPVMLGYLAIGMAFGIMVSAGGYPWALGLLMSVLMYAGAGQYMAIGLFNGGAGLMDLALLTFLVNARHMVYGLSLLPLAKKRGPGTWYLIFALTDETYAVLTTLMVPPPLDQRRVKIMVSALHQLYWIVGTLLGTLAGSLIDLPAEHVGFALTALFLVLVMEQWESRRRPWPLVAAALASALGLALAGKQMLLPAIGIGLALVLGREFLNPREASHA